MRTAAFIAAAGLAGASPSCIFPEFDIVPEVNLPLSFDLSVFEPPSTLADPDVPVTLECTNPDDMKLTLDPRTAVENPDGDVTFWYWIVNEHRYPTVAPYYKGFDVSSPFVDLFVFDACTNTNALVGQINTVKLVIRDRAPAKDNDSVEEVKRIGVGDDPATNIVTLVWQILVLDVSCCDNPVPP